MAFGENSPDSRGRRTHAHAEEAVVASDLSPNNRPTRRLRRALLAPTATILSAIAISGCFDGNPTDKPNFPGMPVPRLGTGDETLKLRVDAAANKGPGTHKLVIGLNMDCTKSGQESTSVTVKDAVNRFETLVCDEPQSDTVIIPPGHPLYNAHTITVHVHTSKPGLPWALSAETRK